MGRVGIAGLERHLGGGLLVDPLLVVVGEHLAGDLARRVDDEATEVALQFGEQLVALELGGLASLGDDLCRPR